MKIAVGTESTLKLRAVKEAFSHIVPVPEILSCKARSGVDEQPIGFEAIVTGARNRLSRATDAHPGADFFIGIESGLIEQHGRWFDTACVAVEIDDLYDSIAFSAFYPIPNWMVDRVQREKTDLGVVIQSVTGGGEKDPMKWLSRDVVPREQLLVQAVLCAVIPLLNQDRYAHAIS